MKKIFIVNVQLTLISIGGLLFPIGNSDVCCLDVPTELQEDYQHFPTYYPVNNIALLSHGRPNINSILNLTVIYTV